MPVLIAALNLGDLDVIQAVDVGGGPREGESESCSVSRVCPNVNIHYTKNNNEIRYNTTLSVLTMLSRVFTTDGWYNLSSCNLEYI